MSNITSLLADNYAGIPKSEYLKRLHYAAQPATQTIPSTPVVNISPVNSAVKLDLSPEAQQMIRGGLESILTSKSEGKLPEGLRDILYQNNMIKEDNKPVATQEIIAKAQGFHNQLRNREMPPATLKTSEQFIVDLKSTLNIEFDHSQRPHTKDYNSHNLQAKLADNPELATSLYADIKKHLATIKQAFEPDSQLSDPHNIDQIKAGNISTHHLANETDKNIQSNLYRILRDVEAVQNRIT